MVPAKLQRGRHSCSVSSVGNDRPLLITTIKAVAAIGVLSLLAANYLADGLDQSGLTRLAASASKAREPAITGSINKVKLDPCAMPRNP